MSSLKNILWVALLTFFLGYLVSTATAGGDYTSPPQAAVQDDVEPDTLPAKVNRVQTSGAALPQNFINGAPNVITRPEALRAAFDIVRSGERPLRVLHIGDSHVAGKDFPLAVRKDLETAWGKADTASTKGLVFNFIGKNGAIAHQFASSERLAQIAEARPDLVIVSFGTNECHGMGYTEDVHRAQLTAFLDTLRATVPNAVILLTTPPGDYITSRTTSYVSRGRKRRRRRVTRSVQRVNPMTERGANLIAAVAAERGLALWNLNAIAGSGAAASRWHSAGLMRPDRIHFTPEGYTLQGRLLADALLAAYNGYLK